MAKCVPSGCTTKPPDLIYLAKKSENIGMCFLYLQKTVAKLFTTVGIRLTAHDIVYPDWVHFITFMSLSTLYIPTTH